MFLFFLIDLIIYYLIYLKKINERRIKRKNSGVKLKSTRKNGKYINIIKNKEFSNEEISPCYNIINYNL